MPQFTEKERSLSQPGTEKDVPSLNRDGNFCCSKSLVRQCECGTPNMVYKGHLYKGQAAGAYGFMALFSTVSIIDRYTGYLTVSFINHTRCIHFSRATHGCRAGGCGAAAVVRIHGMKRPPTILPARNGGHPRKPSAGANKSITVSLPGFLNERPSTLLENPFLYHNVGENPF